MTTIAIVGAGPGLGAAAARRFGAAGFAVALVSRSQERVSALAAELAGEGLSVRGYVANARAPERLADALDAIGQELGPIEVLQYSPLPQKEFLRPVLETTARDLAAALEFSVYGPVTAVHQVLQSMRFLGRGSILFVNGASAIRPNPNVAGTSVAFAAESAYARMLHDTLAAENIQVAQLVIPGAITPAHPTHDPDVLAAKLWHLHTHPGELRLLADNLPDS